ncbi:MAG: endolytic transglycosylase MltG [Armatimonas sp.]
MAQWAFLLALGIAVSGCNGLPGSKPTPSPLPGIKVTFPEGYTLEKMAARLIEKKVLPEETTFLKLATTQGKTFKASFPLPANLEGYLFPDTYNFPPKADEKKIIQMLLTTFDKKVASKITESGKPLKETMIKASLIEREAEVEEDRAKIAGVIENRLKKGMRLQIDATVQYALPEHKSRLLFADLKFKSPYNTYLVKGLPPGPICNPGIPSVEAALQPEKSNYMFYVASKDGKKHLFASTFQEHQKNIKSVRG